MEIFLLTWLQSSMLSTDRGSFGIFVVNLSNYLQKKYWTKLKARQKISLMDILLSLLEFAASYNSSTNLRTRMHQIPEER